jgi:hypothetical protein
VVLPLQLRRRPPPYTDQVLKEKADSWHHGVSPPSHQAWLDSLLAALKYLADRRLTAGVRPLQPPPLADRPPDGEAAPHLRDGRGREPHRIGGVGLLPDLFPRDYAATWARRAIDLRAGRSDDAALWAFAMLPVGQLVSKFSFLSCSAGFWDVGVF